MSQIVTILKKSFKDPDTKPFKCKVRGKIIQGFVVKKNGKFFAYQNKCKHLSIALDLNDGEFLTHDKKQIQCSMHGALYNIESGHCTAGPCEGADLNRFEIEEEPKRLLIIIPDELDTK